MIKISNQYIKIDTNNTSMLFWINGKKLESVYYGKKISDADNYEILHYKNRNNAHAECHDERYTGNYTVSTYGENCDREYSLIIKNSDHSFANKFAFVEAKIVDKPSYKDFPSSRFPEETVSFKFVDKEQNIELIQYYSCYKNCDVISVSNKVTNLNKTTVTVNRLMSLQLDLDGTGYKIHSYYGAWAREREEEITLLNHGIYSNSTSCGLSSHKISPFFYIDSPNRIGGCYGFNLIYSGNHKYICDASTNDITRFMIGLNDLANEIILGENESFVTPEAIMTFGENQNAMSESFHVFINEHIIEPKYHSNRPLVYNSWCLGNDFTKENMYDFAKICSDIGFDIFVIDAGWYSQNEKKEMINGDWIENVEKTGDLQRFSEYLHSINLKFGLWFEPETVHPESNLYKNHPEWLLLNTRREAILLNNTYLLDLSNEEVQNYIYDVVSKGIEKYHLDYIKWDFNRRCIEGYSLSNNAQNYDLNYYKGLYKIYSKLTTNYPNVLFEGCASGGGRFDLGILYYMPQIWTSDCDEALNRVYIQESTLKGFAPSTLSCHVANPMHTSFGRNFRLRDRFAVAVEGNYGYEIDFNLMSEEEKKEMAYQVNLIKPYRETVLFGKHYLIESAYNNSVKVDITVNKEQTQAVARIYKTKFIFNKEPFKYRFKGLNPDYMYRVKMYNSDYTFEVKGDLLNSFGIDLESFFIRDRSGKYESALNTLVVFIDKI